MTTTQTKLGTAAFEGKGPQQLYQEKLAAGCFEIQRCLACARHIFYPRVVCPHCGGTSLEWVVQSGRGTVYSTIVIRRKPDEGGNYNVALIDLFEGARMMGRVVGIEPHDVRIGMSVTARLASNEGAPIVEWIPDWGSA